MYLVIVYYSATNNYECENKVWVCSILSLLSRKNLNQWDVDTSGSDIHPDNPYYYHK